MGTNYYVIKDKCHHCNRGDREYHIGKSSGGWAFTFQGYPFDGLTSWSKWKEYIKDKLIEDEYGDVISYEEFVKLVEVYKAPNFIGANGRKNLLHNDEARKHGYFNSSRDWDDEVGYSFTTVEFS